MKNLLGVILCGGESKRMGTDKGLLHINKTIWAKFVADKLAPLHIPVVYSVNEKQLDAYSAFLHPDELVVDDLDVGGPLKGLLTVHKTHPHNNLLLLACDMLDMNEETIRTILNEYEKENTYDFYVFTEVEFFQPFCGIYTAGGLRKILAEAYTHTLKSYSLQTALQNGVTKEVELLDKKAFRSYNNKEEIGNR